MENNAKIMGRCPFCGKDLELEKNQAKITCPSCNKEISSTMAIKYYESLTEQPTQAKEAHGEDYHKLSYVLDELYGYVDLQEWEKAEEKFNEALALTDVDYKVYMAMVAVKTKNYTDLEDESHKEYINKAISCADEDAKKEIVKTYKAYYHKRGLSEEELQSYSAEENTVKKVKLEKGLKSMIPDYMAKEKRNKVFVWIFPVLLVVGISVLVLALFKEDLAWLSIIGAVLTLGGYFVFRTWFVNRDKVKVFNCLLDLYDFIDSRDYDEQTLGVLYAHMQKHCDKFLENAPIVSIFDDTNRLIDYVITMNDGKMNDFMLASKYFSQFVSAEDGE